MRNLWKKTRLLKYHDKIVALKHRSFPCLATTAVVKHFGRRHPLCLAIAANCNDENTRNRGAALPSHHCSSQPTAAAVHRSLLNNNLRFTFPHPVQNKFFAHQQSYSLLGITISIKQGQKAVKTLSIPFMQESLLHKLNLPKLNYKFSAQHNPLKTKNSS